MIKVAANLLSGEGSLPILQMATLPFLHLVFPWLHAYGRRDLRVENERWGSSLVFLLIRALILSDQGFTLI